MVKLHLRGIYTTHSETIPDLRPFVRVMAKAELLEHSVRQKWHQNDPTYAHYVGSDPVYDYFEMTLPPPKPIGHLSVRPKPESRIMRVFCKLARKDTVLTKRHPINSDQSTWILIKDLRKIVEQSPGGDVQKAAPQ